MDDSANEKELLKRLNSIDSQEESSNGKQPVDSSSNDSQDVKGILDILLSDSVVSVVVDSKNKLEMAAYQTGLDDDSCKAIEDYYREANKKLNETELKLFRLIIELGLKEHLPSIFEGTSSFEAGLKIAGVYQGIKAGPAIAFRVGKKKQLQKTDEVE